MNVKLNATKFIKIPKHYKFTNQKIEIEVPEKLRACQNLCARAIYENAYLRTVLQDKILDEKEYQKTILELDNIIGNN